MTKFEFSLPHPEFDVNGFFEARGYKVETRVRSGLDTPWSVVVRENVSKTDRDSVAAALVAEGAPGSIRHSARPVFAGTPAEKQIAQAEWLYKAAGK